MLTGPEEVKNFPAFYGTRTCVTVFTRACYLSLSTARSIHSTPQPHSLKVRLNIVLPSTPKSSKCPLFSQHSYQNAVCISPHTCHLFHPYHSLLNQRNIIWWEVQIIKLLLMYSSHFPLTSSLSGPSTFLSYFRTPSVYIPP
jgi:hypothetical protein